MVAAWIVAAPGAAVDWDELVRALPGAPRAVQGPEGVRPQRRAAATHGVRASSCAGSWHELRRRGLPRAQPHRLGGRLGGVDPPSRGAEALGRGCLPGAGRGGRPPARRARARARRRPGRHRAARGGAGGAGGRGADLRPGGGDGRGRPLARGRARRSERGVPRAERGMDRSAARFGRRRALPLRPDADGRPRCGAGGDAACAAPGRAGRRSRSGTGSRPTRGPRFPSRSWQSAGSWAGRVPGEGPGPFTLGDEDAAARAAGGRRLHRGGDPRRRDGPPALGFRAALGPDARPLDQLPRCRACHSPSRRSRRSGARSQARLAPFTGADGALALPSRTLVARAEA